MRVRTKRSLSKIAHSSQLLARYRQPCGNTTRSHIGRTRQSMLLPATSVVDPVSVADIEPRSNRPAEVHVKLALLGVDPLISVDPPSGLSTTPDYSLKETVDMVALQHRLPLEGQTTST